MFLISDVIGCIQRICVVFQEKESQAVFDFTSSLSTKLYVAVCACLLQVLMCILVCVPKKGQGSVYRCHMHTHIHTHKAMATRLILPRRQINAVRTQCQCNVFVYFSPESLAPPEQPDRTPTPPPAPPPPLQSPPLPPVLSFHN